MFTSDNSNKDIIWFFPLGLGGGGYNPRHAAACRKRRLMPALGQSSHSLLWFFFYSFWFPFSLPSHSLSSFFFLVSAREHFLRAKIGGSDTCPSCAGDYVRRNARPSGPSGPSGDGGKEFSPPPCRLCVAKATNAGPRADLLIHSGISCSPFIFHFDPQDGP